MSLSHLEGRPRTETPCQKPFQTKTGCQGVSRLGALRHILMGCIHPTCQPPTPPFSNKSQIYKELQRLPSLTNSNKTRIFFFFLNLPTRMEEAELTRAALVSVLVINRLTAGHFLLAGSWGWAVNCEGIQKGQAAQGPFLFFFFFSF